MRRLKSIDIYRGLVIFLMVWVHLRDWWLIEEALWFSDISRIFIDRALGQGFIFISGLSSMLWYRNRFDKANNSKDYSFRLLKDEYLFRALILLVIALIYNSFVAIMYLDASIIWEWFMLLSIAFSLILAWPLLKTSKTFRIFFIIFVFIINQIAVTFLLPYEGELNFFGVIFYVFYNSLFLDPILASFSFFLIGTIMGDIIYDIILIEDNHDKRKAVKFNLLIPSLVVGTILIIFELIFLLPLMLLDYPFSWVPFAVGIILILVPSLFTFEIYGYIETKKSYKVLYYFSYYSLTIYLVHNIFYFLFYRKLNLLYFWIVVIITLVLFTLLLKILYNKWGAKFSIKSQMGIIAGVLARRVEVRKANNYRNKDSKIN